MEVLDNLVVSKIEKIMIPYVKTSDLLMEDYGLFQFTSMSMKQLKTKLKKKEEMFLFKMLEELPEVFSMLKIFGNHQKKLKEIWFMVETKIIVKLLILMKISKNTMSEEKLKL